jgi:topoisomerase-4 subunit A
VKDLPQMPRGKGNRILNVPTAKFAKSEEAVAGVAVFGEGKPLVIHTAKGDLTVSREEVELYEGERAQRGSRLPKGYQEVTGIEVKE